MRRLCVFLLAMGLTVSTGFGAELRTWTDKSGEFKIRARLTGIKVVLEKSDGKTIEVPFDQLSRLDQGIVAGALPELKVIVGKVTGVSDGDSITVRDKGGGDHKVRLVGIDAPEGTQKFGVEARNVLTSKILDKTVTVEWSERDKYQRVLGKVCLGDRWINKELAEEGCAWHYTEYSTDKDLAEAEKVARGKKVGLWSESAPMPPWEFRHPPPNTASVSGLRRDGGTTERAAPVSKVETTPAKPPQAETTVYVTKTGSKYHRAGCSYLRSSSRPIPLSAAKRSYSPCSRCNPP